MRRKHGVRAQLRRRNDARFEVAVSRGSTSRVTSSTRAPGLTERTPMANALISE
jgi:hypothetical protein